MAEYILSEHTIEDKLLARVYADTVTNLPTRVEVKGVAGKYRFTVASPDKSRSFTANFDSDVNISRSIPTQIASKYTDGWTFGVEGI